MKFVTNSGNKRKDLCYLTVLILFVGAVACLFCFYIFPTVINEEHNFSSEPIHLNLEWENVSKHDNAYRPFPWFVESRDIIEIPVNYDNFINFYNQKKIIDVKYVIEKNHIKLYGLEEITGKNGSYFNFRTTILSPEKTRGYSKFTGYEMDQSGAVVFTEKDYDIAISKVVITVIAVVLMLFTLSLLREFVIVFFDKDYKSKKETDEEMRR